MHHFIACKSDTLISKNCDCALTHCGSGKMCIAGTKCEYPGKIYNCVNQCQNSNISL